jgi:hypothetical protein
MRSVFRNVQSLETTMTVKHENVVICSTLRHLKQSVGLVSNIRLDTSISEHRVSVTVR